MAHGQGATSNRTGGYGVLSRGSRGHGADKSVKKQITRERDPRIQAAIEETRKAQEELDELIERQKNEPAVGATAGALYAAQEKKAREALLAAQAAEQEAVGPEQPEPEPEKSEPISYEDFQYQVDGKTYDGIAPVWPKFNTKKLRKDGEDKFPFASTTAQMMLKAGYHISYVMEFTGIGYREVENFPLDDEGYGWVDKDKDETPEA